MVVPIGGLEDNGFILDVGHVDVADEDVFGFATPFDGALETQTGVCTTEFIASHDNVFHTA